MSVVIGTVDAPPRVAAPTVSNESVSRAFAIGWQMTDLFLTGRTTAGRAADAGALPSIATLDARQQTALGIAEILAGVQLIDPNGKYTQGVEAAWKAVEQAFDDEC